MNGICIALGYGMAAHNLAYIEKSLRQGKDPAELGGKEIGKGVCKAAYLFNDSFVVKLNAQAGFKGSPQKTPPKFISEYGARAPRTYKAGKYIIQEYVKVLAEVKDYTKTKAYETWRELRMGKGREYDMHEYNCGVDANGQLVVFDW